MMAQSQATAAGLDAGSRAGDSGALPQLPEKIVITPQRRCVLAVAAVCLSTRAGQVFSTVVE